MPYISSRSVRITMLALLALLMPLAAAAGQAQEEPDSTVDKAADRFEAITDWIVLGPVPAPLPAFRDESKGKFDASWLLQYGHLETAGLTPAEGQPVGVPGSGDASWRARSADTAGVTFQHEGPLPGPTRH